MAVEYGTSRVTVEHGKSSVLMVGAPDEDSSEEELDEVVAKGELGKAVVVGWLAVGAWNEVNEDGLDETARVGAGLEVAAKRELGEMGVGVVLVSE